jgi:RsiW-degrading membrane proteinase PrsW (M82 family)
MTCGALVGLGFAAEENVQYFRELSAGAAIGRFLTANFLHMALTSIVALSVFGTLRGRQTSRDGFNVIFPLAVALHGAYDFLLTSDDFPLGSFVAMALLFVLCRAFLRQLSIASRAVEMQSLLRLFVWSLTLLTGVSYVYATTLVGPLLAIELVAMGVLGVSILIYLFVRELSES